MIEIRRENIVDGLQAIEKGLEEKKISDRERRETVLISEEVLVRLFKGAEAGAVAEAEINGSFDNTYVDISIPGKKTDLLNSEFYSEAQGVKFDTEDMGENTEEAIRSLVLNSFENRFRYSYRKGINSVHITASLSQYSLLYKTLTGLVLGIGLGLVAQSVCSREFLTVLDTHVLKIITEIFLRILQIMVGPIVFLSIATGISGFGKFSDMGRIGGKVMGVYMLTSVFAIVLAILVFRVFQPGNPALAEVVLKNTYAMEIPFREETSLRDMLIGFFPTSIPEPFLKENTLGIIVISLLLGVGMSMTGKSGQKAREGLVILNEICLKIITILVKFMPLVIFCSMFSMSATMGGEGFLSILEIFFAILMADAGMLVFYGLLLLIIGRVNPIRFFRKYFPTMLQVFRLSSGNAAIPLNMKACDEKLGISSRVYSFSIPLGATVNMDGVCIALAIVTLAFGQVFGIEFNSSRIICLALIILVLAIGAPGIPGAGLVFMAVCLNQFDIPIAAVGMIMGIISLMDMFATTMNCTGDVVTSMLVARTEKLVDMEVFKKDG